MQRGKLIVIEGTDGSGKSTQLQMLLSYFASQHIPYLTVGFPQYDKTFFGRTAGRYLQGEFGDVNVSPYLTSIPYAADRWQAKPEIVQALEEGNVVLLNRYVTSNTIYHGAKLISEKQDEFITWNNEMEYDVFGMPKEDIVVYMHVPTDVAQTLVDKRGAGKDIHEADVLYLKEVERLYLISCTKFPHWVKIDCAPNGQLLSKEQIHEQVIAVLAQKGILSNVK